MIACVRRDLEACDYPYEHAKGKITVGEFSLTSLPDSDNPGEIYEAAESLTESAIRLRARLTGHLCLIAEQVESVLGLEPLAQPVGDDEKAAEAQT